MPAAMPAPTRLPLVFAPEQVEGLVQCEELQLLATAQIVQQSSRPDLVEVVPCQIQLRNRRERATLITPRHLCDTERGDAIVPQAQFLDMGAARQRLCLTR